MKELNTITNDLCSPVSPVPPREYHFVRSPSMTKEVVTQRAMIAETTVNQKAVDREYPSGLALSTAKIVTVMRARTMWTERMEIVEKVKSLQ